MTRLSRNIAWNVVGQTANLIAALASARLVFHNLGSDALGIILFTLSLNAITISILDLGISNTIVRSIARAEHSDYSYVTAIARTASSLFWGAWIVASITLFITSPAIVQRWIHITDINPDDAISTIRILGISALSALPRGGYAGALRGLQRMGWTNSIDVLLSISQQLGAVVVIALGGGVVLVAASFAVALGVALLAYILVTWRIIGARALVPWPSKLVARREAGFASAMSVVSILGVFELQTDRLIASKLLPLGILGPYSFLFAIVSRATFITWSIFQAALPALAQLHTSEMGSDLRRQYSKLQDLQWFAAVPPLAAVVFAEPALLSYEFSGAIASELFIPLVLVCTGYFLNTATSILYMISLVMGKPRITLQALAFALAAGIPIAIGLVFSLGILGAALSWVLINALTYVVMVPRICRECLRIPPWHWFRRLLGRVLPLTVLTYGVSATLISTLGLTHQVSLVLVAFGVASVLFCWGGFLLAGPELRESLETGARQMLYVVAGNRPSR